LPVVKPKHEMTEREHHPRQAFAMVREELMLDGDIRCRNKEFVFALGNVTGGRLSCIPTF
jgi:hypothetical protein